MQPDPRRQKSWAEVQRECDEHNLIEPEYFTMNDPDFVWREETD